jgi:hypothetical protein
MATVRLEYYGVEGVGRTVTEAKRDAGRKIEASLAGYYNPELLEWRGWAILLYRTPAAWHYSIVVEPTAGVRAGVVYGNFRHDRDHKEAKADALAHLAQLGWTHDDGENSPDFLSPPQAREMRSWAQFQLRYKTARDRGLTDQDCHSYAGRDPSRPELWMNEPAAA